MTRIPTASTATRAETPFREEFGFMADAFRFGRDSMPVVLAFNLYLPRKMKKLAVR